VQTIIIAAIVGYTCGSNEFFSSSVIYNGSGGYQCIGISQTDVIFEHFIEIIANYNACTWI